MDWFLYDRNPLHERVKELDSQFLLEFLKLDKITAEQGLFHLIKFYAYLMDSQLNHILFCLR